MSLTWFDGALHADEIPVSPRDRGLTLGDGVFETILVQDHRAIWRDEHLARMMHSAEALGIACPSDEIDEAISVLLDQAGQETSVLRLTLSRGVTTRGLSGNAKRPTLVATLDHFDESLMFKPALLITSSVRRNHGSPASRMKTLSYIDNILAAREAQNCSVDDAVMLNTDGDVACTTMANIFMLKGETLHTPHLGSGALPGIARAKLLSIWPVTERSITRAELIDADSVFTTNSLRLLRPILSLDGHAVPQAALKKYEASLLDAVNAR